MPVPEVRQVRNISVFSNLPDDALLELCAACHWRSYGAGREILTEQDSTRDVFFILTGRVQAKSFLNVRRDIVYDDICAGALFGEFSAIDGKPRSASIVTLEPTFAGRMSSRSFEAFLEHHPAAAWAVLQHVVGKARGLTDRIFADRSYTVQQRVHAEILRRLEAVGDGRQAIDPAPTHAELAARIGCNREAVTRELRYLASRQIIDYGRRRIDVLDGSWLRASLDSVQNPPHGR